MTRRLHPVTGVAKFCGPCALSAITGRSGDDWPDRPMHFPEIEAALVDAGMRPDRLPHDSWAIGRSLRAFADPTMMLWPERRPVLDPSGRWILHLATPPDPEPTHVVAVRVTERDGNASIRRDLVDNNIRKPTGFGPVVNREPYSKMLVVAGLHVPDAGVG